MQLDQYQQSAVTAPLQDIQVLAGAGSGKTRVIVERIGFMVENLSISPTTILAITYTRKAAMEMRERLSKRLGHRANKVFVGTIHSWCLAQLFRFGHRIGWRPESMSILDDDQAEAMLDQTLEDLGFRKGGKLKGIKKKDIEQALRDYGACRQPENDDLRQVLAAFRSACREANCLTYSMILQEATALFADQEAKEILQREYQEIILDEAQDTIPAQWLIIDLLAPKSRFIVGDPRQSIFGFAGASLKAHTRHTSDCKTFPLAYNYRSDIGIVDEGNRVTYDFTATLPAAATSGKIEVVPVTSETVANLVQTIIPRFAFDEIAILCRVHRPLAKSVAALREAGLPIHYPGGARIREEHPHTRAIHAHFSLMINPWDLFAFREIASFYGFDPVLTQTIRTRAATDRLPILHAWNDHLGWAPDDPPMVKWQDFDPAVTAWIQEKLRDIAGPLDENNTEQVIAKYLRWYAMKDIQSGLEKVPENHIQALSIHQAKGLEWPCAILLGASEGILPSSRSRSAEDLDEERRLYYVAVTRAKHRLIICPRPDAEPSRFIEDIEVAA